MSAPAKISRPNGAQPAGKSLRQTLRRTSLFPAMALVIFLLGFIVLAGGRILREVISVQDETVHALARQLDQYLEERGRALETLARTVTVLPDDRREDLLERAQSVYPSLSSLYLLDEKGRVIAAVGGRFDLTGLDLSGESFFRHAPISENAYFSAPFISLATGRVATTVAAAVYRDGGLQSILVGELDLSQVQSAVIPEGGAREMTFVVDQDGVLIAHPEQSWVQEQRNMADLRLVQRGLDGENTYEVFYYPPAGAWYVGSVAPMHSGWVAVTMQPLLVAARTLFLLLGAATLAIGAALSLVLRLELRSFRQLANPILYLAEQADAISKGEKADFDPQRTGEYREMALLGHSLAHMMQALEERTRSLAESWKDYETIINAVPEMIWYVDVDGRVIRANRFALTTMNARPEEVLGKTMLDLYPPEMAAGFQRDTSEVIASGQPRLGIVERYLTGDGELRWSETDKLPYLDADGKAIGAIIFSRDITERQRAAEELARHRTHLEDLVGERTAELNRRVVQVEELNQALAQLLDDLRSAQERTEQAAQTVRAANHELEAFAYTVSHDLRGPLRHINAYSKLLIEAEGNRLEPSSRELLDAILASVERMGHLIEDLLAFSRTGRAEIDAQQVALADVVEQARSELKPQMIGRCIHWKIGDLPLVEGDPSLLRQVWVNLLSNAIKFTNPRDEAVIEVGALPVDADGMATVFVRDNGVGFDPRLAEKLFGVFQRLHRMDEFEGTGIGLATVRRIVQRHGGRAWAESAPDGGATFYIRLPMPTFRSEANRSSSHPE